MRVTDIRTHLVSARPASDPAWQEPYFPGGYEVSTALIEVKTDEGISGLGETIAGYFCGPAVDPVVQYFATRIHEEKLDPLRPAAAFRDLYHASGWWGRVGLGLSVLSGIEMALWDLAGKVAGKPVYELLGGPSMRRLRLYASAGAALYPLDRMLEQAHFYTSRGYRAMKFATGFFGRPDGTRHAPTEARRVAEEHEKISALRSAFGEDVDVALDVHAMSLREPWQRKTSLAIAKSLEELSLWFLEEPLPYNDPAGYAELAHATSTPIAGGEVLTGLVDFAPYLERGAFDIVQPDASHVGGILMAVQVAHAAGDRGRAAIFHGGGAFGPAHMANVHASFACSNVLALEDVVNFADLRSELLVDELVIRDGHIDPPRAPGLGVELDRAFVEAHPYRPGAWEYC